METVLVEFVAVEAEAAFQPQRIARAEADRLHPLIPKQGGPERFRIRVGDRDLKPVLAGIARARELDRDAGDPPGADGHERHRRDIEPERRHHRLGIRPLQGDEGLVVLGLQPHAGGQARRHMGIVDRLARGVDDETDDAVALHRTMEHQVVDQAAVVGQELRIALHAGLQVQDVGADQRLQRRGRRDVVRADETCLPHVRHVEQAGVLARPAVLGEDAGWILHRHQVAGERYHAGAGGFVRGLERRRQNGRVGAGTGGRGHRDFRVGGGNDATLLPPPTRGRKIVAPPLSRIPERFPGSSHGFTRAVRLLRR